MLLDPLQQELHGAMPALAQLQGAMSRLMCWFLVRTALENIVWELPVPYSPSAADNLDSQSR